MSPIEGKLFMESLCHSGVMIADSYNVPNVNESIHHTIQPHLTLFFTIYIYNG